MQFHCYVRYEMVPCEIVTIQPLLNYTYSNLTLSNLIPWHVNVSEEQIYSGYIGKGNSVHEESHYAFLWMSRWQKVQEQGVVPFD